MEITHDLTWLVWFEEELNFEVFCGCASCWLSIL